MALYIEHAFRVIPPRSGNTMGSGAQRAIACNASTTSFELDNDIFQFAPAANTVGTPGGFGPALVQFTADGGDIYINFGPTNAVVANSAATSGNTVADKIPQDKALIYEISPKVDLWCSARTANGGSVTATLRYRIIGPPTRANP
jgi:hypothetical protein